jgi:hypothetical protein
MWDRRQPSIALFQQETTTCSSEWVTGVQHPSKYLITRERIDGEPERLDW